jgi:hypothetical protein
MCVLLRDFLVPLRGNLTESYGCVLPRDLFIGDSETYVNEGPGTRRPSPYGFSCGTIVAGYFTRDFGEQVVTLSGDIICWVQLKICKKYSGKGHVYLYGPRPFATSIPCSRAS